MNGENKNQRITLGVSQEEKEEMVITMNDSIKKKAKGEVYGFLEKIKSESECVAELMKMYQQMTEKE